jgi:hypothetical protein
MDFFRRIVIFFCLCNELLVSEIFYDPKWPVSQPFEIWDALCMFHELFHLANLLTNSNNILHGLPTLKELLNEIYYGEYR